MDFREQASNAQSKWFDENFDSEPLFASLCWYVTGSRRGEHVAESHDGLMLPRSAMDNWLVAALLTMA